eukprot:7386105-Prymnesium_polylepis.2
MPRILSVRRMPQRALLELSAQERDGDHASLRGAVGERPAAAAVGGAGGVGRAAEARHDRRVHRSSERRPHLGGQLLACQALGPCFPCARVSSKPALDQGELSLHTALTNTCHHYALRRGQRVASGGRARPASPALARRLQPSLFACLIRLCGTCSRDVRATDQFEAGWLVVKAQWYELVTTSPRCYKLQAEE